MLAKLVSGMDKERFSNQVICLLPEGVIAERIREVGVPVRTLNFNRSRPSLRGLLCLVRLLRQAKPHILQTWLYHADLLGMMARKAAGVKCLAWNIRNSEMEFAYYSPLTKIVVRLCARFSFSPDAIIANSFAGRDQHIQMGYRPDRFSIIPNGFDTDVFCPDLKRRLFARKALGIDNGDALVGMVARFDAQKDHATFIEAAATVVKSISGVKFLFCGEGLDVNNYSVMSLLEKFSLVSKVLLLGRRNDVPDIMNALDILVSSSFGEGFPSVIGEAMACGIPCVATDVGDSARIVGDTGVVIPPKDPSALADGICKLLTISASERVVLQQRARRRIVEHFALPRVVRQYESLYTELARGLGRK